ncbi:valine--tRNA ligase [Methanobacterium alkalithermotolerans]|uniref:Valine--tRNA ligase n=1 Tax=Methanobacterium alkalithermotolerans TaxID=2731220 RepID=A0A8T8K4J9_9EURY|nr:valine--tRNA ligase [Methanobacterium alkalithermotolerans]QUH22839.1 valine--tRNA ligase [Methanobacterium alkalithermotolerans]
MTADNIPKDYDHKKESIWQEKWQENQLHRFIGDGTRPRYIIDTPPPYPTGSIHIGHVLNWVFMDIIARYKRMNGFDVLFPQGWDCHGLPTEVKVEETHSIKKNDVSREDFRKMCVDLTRDNIATMKNQMQSMGFSQDWNREYITMTPEYMQKTQLSFLKMKEQGLIYQGIHPVNWCPRCETAIAFAEVEYNENETFLNFLEFPSEDADKGVMIATTRPELLSACVAVVVHPEDDRYHELKGKKVQVPIFGQKVEIITDSEVDPEFGTGAVMICTFGDKTDVSWVNRYDLDIIEAIDEQGIMTSAAGKYEGLTLSQCKEKTIKDLEKQGCLIKKEKVEQNVGQCWRCKSPIEILVKKQWFVAVKKLVHQVEEAADAMDWIPEHMKTRLLNWTGSMDWDWCISRQRIFATPIPVWYCEDCGEVHVATPEMIPVDPTQVNPPWKCQCGGSTFQAEEDVLDTWMDSSISPLVIAGWPDEQFKNYFPADLRPQGHDIIRTWAFYTTLRSKALTGMEPFHQIVINGMVFGEDGHKMSKSRGNVISPESVLEDYGADALRLWASNSVPGSDVPFAWKDVKYGYKFLRKFWNAFRFISMHIFEFKTPDMDLTNLKPMDRWILSKLNRLVEDVSSSMAQYNFAQIINPIQRFIWHDFCDEYIEAVKYRLYNDDNDLKSKEAAQYTLKTVIETSLKLLAPITPHFSDEVYQHLSSDKSIHQMEWPAVKVDLIDSMAEDTGNLGVEIIGDLRRFKSSKGMPLNATIKETNIYTSSSAMISTIKPLIDDIKGTIRISNLNLDSGKLDIQEKVVEITPLMNKIGPEFKGDAPKILSYLQSQDPQDISSALEKEGKITIEGHEISEEYISMKKEAVGKSGEKVDILHLNQGIVIEIII